MSSDHTSADEQRTGSAQWWRQTALRLRSAIAFGFMALVLSASLAVVAYAMVRSSLIDERTTLAERQAYTNARLLRSRIDPLPADMSQLLAGLQVGPTGNSLLQADGSWFSSSVQVTPSDLPASLTDRVSENHAARQRFVLGGEPVLAIGVPITAVEAQYYEMSSLAEVDSTLQSLSRALLVAGLVATGVGAGVGAALSSVILQPLRRFAAVARRIAAGESTSRLDAGGDADLVPLAHSFNEMLDELDERVERERRFASDVSHEIRGPLAALASAVSIVDRRRSQLPEEIVPVVDALDEQVSAFNQLVLDLLEISRFDARTARLELDSVDLRHVCEQVLVERGFEGVELRAHPDGPLVSEVDRRRIEQVLVNLLENARLYAGGATDVELTRAADGTTTVRVMDRGPGVDEAERVEIFTRFRRGSASDRPGAERGTGLGLALSSQHVALHGGRLWVEDRDGGGATFVVELPSGPPLEERA
jgi:two-component system, OmpR family, sensor histidine kinase MtrB